MKQGHGQARPKSKGRALLRAFFAEDGESWGFPFTIRCGQAGWVKGPV